LNDLDFADDVALISTAKQHLQTKTERLVDQSERMWLKINVGKTKTMRIEDECKKH